MNDTTARIFEFKDEKSSKFWEVTQTGSTVRVRFGKTGTNGQSQDKAFSDAAAAANHVQKLIAEKTGKGYVELGAYQMPPVDAATTAAKRPDASQPEKAQFKSKPAIAAKPAKPKNPAHDPEASSESLLAMLDKADTTNRLLARHPRASTDLLEKLSHSSDEATRRNVAGNPNTHPETFIKLGQQFPKEFLANPALDLLLLVNPGLMEQIPQALLIRLLKQADCPASLLGWAADHKEAKVQLAVAMNKKSPAQAQEKLRTSLHTKVRQTVLGADQIGTADDPEKAFEQAVRERLGQCTEEVVSAWRDGDIGLGQWPFLSPLLRARVLSIDPAHFVMSEFVPIPILKLYARSSFTYADRECAAKNPLLPSDELELILNGLNEFFKVSFSYIKNKLGSYYDSWGEEDSIACAVISNPRLSLDAISQFSISKNDRLREAVARNPNSPVSIIDTLLEDPSSDVQEKACAHPSLSLDVISRLSTSESESIRIGVARNPSTPTPVVDKLLKDSSHLVQAAACEHKVSTASYRDGVAG